MAKFSTYLESAKSRPLQVTERATQLFYHPVQRALWDSEARFRVAVAGRRSGKTEHAIRFLVKRAMLFHEEIGAPNGKFIFGAPTRDQAKRLFWEPLKQMVPPRLITKIYESELVVLLINGVRIGIVGFDKPMRAEGEAIDGAVLDEYADMKEEAWKLSIRPSLGTIGRSGWCWFIGKPRGRNHYWKLYQRALADESGEWAAFHWSAEDVLPEQEIASLKRDLDPLSYDQEVRANFVNFSGRIYYAFFTEVQASIEVEYLPTRPLAFCFDFNVDPGVCAIEQFLFRDERVEFDPVFLAGEHVTPYLEGWHTTCIDEVYIPDNSRTLAVCNALRAKWGKRHTGFVDIYGDASGGARKTSSNDGSDWDIIKRELSKVDGWKLRFHVATRNPPERARVNATNTQLMASDGRVRTLLNPKTCPRLCADLEGVESKKDGSGDIDKKSNPDLTHISDGHGYRIAVIAPEKGYELKIKQM